MYKNVEIIEKVNNGEKSLSKVYNEIINESNNDIVVLIHDDLEFDTKHWDEKIARIFNKNLDFGIIGLAGTTVMPKSGMWWEDRTKMFGIVNHKHEGKKWESKYSDSLGESLKSVVLVDGLFIAINKKNINHTFDESVEGFHMYDVNFCIPNFLSGVKIGITTLIRVTHLSIGQTNEMWEKNRLIFSEKFKKVLPIKTKISKSDNIKILCITNNDSSLFFDLLNNLEKNFEINFLCNNISGAQQKLLKKKNILFFDENKIPGIKIGDGKWSLNINGKTQLSQNGIPYNFKNTQYDFILSEDKNKLNYIKTIFPKTPKILISDDKKILHNTIITKEKLQIEEINTIIVDTLNTFEVPKNKIKIVSGYSNKGGSTVAFINLTNTLNDYGYDCTFYGPNTWHLDKCKSDLIDNLNFEPDDRIICHFMKLPKRPNVRKIVFSCHEKWWWNFNGVEIYWDDCVFLHEEHRQYHKNYKGNYTIIPNIRESLTSIIKDDKNLIAGVIGTIEERKQTHVSIQRAISDGCEKILLFGNIGDQNYFDSYVKDYLKDGKVELVGFVENKQTIYDSIGRVYHSSKGEVASLVKDECYQTNTIFYGNDETNNIVSNLTNEEVINLWKKTIEL